MEEYSDIEIDTSDACVAPRAPDATPTTMRGPEHEGTYQAQQVRQPGAEIEKNQPRKVGGPPANQWKRGGAVQAQGKARIARHHPGGQTRGIGHQAVRKPGTSRRKREDGRVEG